jgi:hypothetical protein
MQQEIQALFDKLVATGKHDDSQVREAAAAAIDGLSPDHKILVMRTLDSIRRSIVKSVIKR